MRLRSGTVASIKRKYRSFTKARAFARRLKLKSGAKWYKYCKGLLPGKPPLPADIPYKPDRTYKDKGWAGMGDWLGTGTVATRLRTFRSFTKARAFARNLKLKNQKEWNQYCKEGLPGKPPLPVDIPTAPRQKYKDKGWVNWGDWLGTGTVATRLRTFRSFTKARAFARRLNLKSRTEWEKYCKGAIQGKPPLPADIPSNPNNTYMDKGWTSWGNWLGTGTISPSLRKYRSFTKARAFARSLKLKSRTEWNRYCKGEIPDKLPFPADIPTNPHRTYKDKGWKSVSDWLGK